MFVYDNKNKSARAISTGAYFFLSLRQQNADREEKIYGGQQQNTAHEMVEMEGGGAIEVWREHRDRCMLFRQSTEREHIPVFFVCAVECFVCALSTDK
jgi:hypothetical protein